MIKPTVTVSTEPPPVAENEVSFVPEDARGVALRGPGRDVATPEDKPEGWREDELQGVRCLLTPGSYR